MIPVKPVVETTGYVLMPLRGITTTVDPTAVDPTAVDPTAVDPTAVDPTTVDPN